MVLSFDADGSQAVTSSETFLFVAITDERTYFCHIFCHNMTSGDVYDIRTYINDKNASTTRVEYKDRISFSDVENKPVYYIPPIPTDSFRVSIQKISGTDRTFTWRRGSF